MSADRPNCPGCGHRVAIVTDAAYGDVVRPIVVSVKCPHTKKVGGQTHVCRQPTAILHDRYGTRYLFAPTFAALDAVIVEAKRAAA